MPIVPFYDSKADCELRLLAQYLRGLRDCPSIRDEHCRILRCHEYGRFQQPEDLLLHLYSYEHRR